MADDARRTDTTDEPGPDETNQLVVIGSSAGGIDALTRIARALPKDLPVAVVVAQHLSPQRPSHLPEILQRHSQLPVRSVEDRVDLEPGAIYVLPADSGAVITDHEIRLVQREPRGPNPSIDHVLTSAAHVFGEGLIAVILTGTGSDGAIGAREVKLAGGTVIVQNPETASYPGMPLSIGPRSIDIVAELDAIGPLLHDLATGAHAPSRQDDERLLRSFLGEIRERSGIDFNTYKRATILRRLQRRMVATGVTRLRDYVRYVHAHDDEYEKLATSFLIKVTQFFRDADLFEHLRDVVIPQLIAEARGRDRELRIWSAGCATGEEAYSLAILVADALGDELDHFNVRIFATDVDGGAITFARRGIYTESAVADLPPGVLERHFMKVGEGFEIRKSIRAMTVFGQHDLGQRAPFPRVDLALCRNVLIYFTAELQKRALQLFAFSLRDGGYLALGKAESTTPLADYFVLAEPRLRIYRRQGDRVLIPPSRIRDTLPAIRPQTPRRLGWSDAALQRARDTSRPASVAEKAEALLLRLPVGVVVVDRRYDIQSINAAARRMLAIHGPAIGEDFVHLVPSAVTELCRNAVDEALRGNGGGGTAEITTAVPDGTEMRSVQISSHPILAAGDAGSIESALLLTTDVTAATSARRELEKALAAERSERDRLVARASEQATTYAELVEANLQLTTANAELRSANEELLVANEEVQAATEEVETLNEELQATNEELETLNEELQATVEELNTTNDDLQARSLELQESTIATEAERTRVEAHRVRTERLLDRLDHGMAVFDGSGELVIANEAYRQALDPAGSLVDADGRPLPVDELPPARARRGEPFDAQVTVLRKKKHSETVRINGAPLGDDPGYFLVEVRRVD